MRKTETGKQGERREDNSLKAEASKTKQNSLPRHGLHIKPAADSTGMLITVACCSFSLCHIWPVWSDSTRLSALCLSGKCVCVHVHAHQWPNQNVFMMICNREGHSPWPGGWWWMPLSLENQSDRLQAVIYGQGIFVPTLDQGGFRGGLMVQDNVDTTWHDYAPRCFISALTVINLLNTFYTVILKLVKCLLCRIVFGDASIKLVQQTWFTWFVLVQSYLNWRRNHTYAHTIS